MGSTSSANRSLGNHPSGINSAVIKPHAMDAPMLGITIPLRKLPNLCTFTLRLAPPEPLSPPAALAWAMVLPPMRLLPRFHPPFMPILGHEACLVQYTLTAA